MNLKEWDDFTAQERMEMDRQAKDYAAQTMAEEMEFAQGAMTDAEKQFALFRHRLEKKLYERKLDAIYREKQIGHVQEKRT